MIEAVDFYTVAVNLHPWSSPRRVPLEQRRGALELQGRFTPVTREAYEKAELIRGNSRAIVYIAGGLTGVDEETKKRYGSTSEFLASYGNTFFGYAPHLHGTDPIKHPNVTPQEVRDVDSLWAEGVADLHVNFLDPVAHGNAIEVGWAEMKMIPTVYVVPENTSLSRLTRGMENVVEMITYFDFETDGKEKMKVLFDEFDAWLGCFPGRDPRDFFYMSLTKARQIIMDDALIGEELVHDRSDDYSPILSPGEILVYVKDPNLPDYGKVGELRVLFADNGWQSYSADFGTHRNPLGDVFFGRVVDLNSFSFWLGQRLDVGGVTTVKGARKFLRFFS